MVNYATGIIFEGVPATGKSSIIREVLKRPEVLNRDFMPFFTFGEDITQRVLEDKHNQDDITIEDNLNLLDDILNPLEHYNQYYQQRGWSLEEKEHRYAFILERFHLTHTIYFNHIRWKDMIAIDNRLEKLDTKLCLLKMKKEAMAERIIDSRCAKWRRYISRFGDTRAEIIGYYHRQQQRKEKLVEKSNLSSLILDTSHGNWQKLAQEIIKFWDI